VVAVYDDGGMMVNIVAVDIGGTFTDLVTYDPETGGVTYSKTLTNHQNLVDGVADCIHGVDLDLGSTVLFKHGTTQIINAFVQRAGARTALVTTLGFRDLLEIGRANRPVQFQLAYRRDPPLVPRPLRFEVGGRIDGHGHETEPLDMTALEDVAQAMDGDGVEAVAVSFLNAYANPVHEEQAVDFLRHRLPGRFVTCGTALSREWYEYERTSTAVANAYVGPKTNEYIERFERELRSQGFRRTFYMMASNGGVLSVERTLAQPVALVESGPVGGCIGACAYARALDLDRVVALDMGGTTAKCAVIEDGRFQVQPDYYVDGYERGFPIRASVVDIVEVGAGGGSIAAVDSQGRLTVGPRSAGSEPGPVSFGRGGTEPTVTDANVVLGRIQSGTFLDGALPLDEAAARRAIDAHVAPALGYGENQTDRVADGIVQLAITTMANAIQRITIERGLDIREFALFSIGGGGPLHAAGLARELRISEVVVPPEPGNFSAVGMLLADARLDDAQTFIRDLAEDSLDSLRGILAEMEAKAAAALKNEVDAEHVAFEPFAEIRYKGQRHSIRVPIAGANDLASLRARFDESYRRQYGQADPTSPTEFIAIRLAALATTPRPDITDLGRRRMAASGEPVLVRPVYFAETGRIETPVFERNQLDHEFASEGPLIIVEYGATTVVGPGDRVAVGSLGELRVACGR